MVPVVAQVPVVDPREPDDRERDGVVEQADVAGVDEQRLPRGQLVGDDLARELDPGLALALQLLEDEALPAPQAPPEATAACPPRA